MGRRKDKVVGAVSWRVGEGAHDRLSRGSAVRSEAARTGDSLQVTRVGWEKQGAMDCTPSY